MGEPLSLLRPGAAVLADDVGGTDLEAALADEVRPADRLPAAAPFLDVVVVPIGTGIAGAVSIQARPHAGGGMAGEIGHSKVADEPGCARAALGDPVAAGVRESAGVVGAALRARDLIGRGGAA